MTKRVNKGGITLSTITVVLAIILVAVAVISFITALIMVYIFHYNTIHFLIQAQRLIHSPPTLIFFFYLYVVLFSSVNYVMLPNIMARIVR